MKPPKPLRNIVNSLIGKRTKSAIKEPGKESLRKHRRRYGSEDDLVTDTAFENRQREKSRKSKFQSLPSRSRSCNNSRPSTLKRQAACDEFGNNSRRVKDRSPLSRVAGANDSENVEDTSGCNTLRKPTVDHKVRSRDHAKIQRTTSLNFTHSGDDSGSRSTGHNVPEHRGRGAEPRAIRRTTSALALRPKETDEELRKFHRVLERLSAQVQEIKDVSKQKHESNKTRELERKLKRLDLSTTQRHQVRDPCTSDTGSCSSGYYSENSNARHPLAPHHQPQRVSTSPRYESSESSNTFRAPHHPHANDMKQLYSRPIVTRADSSSSGYATGSGSDDDRQDTTDRKHETVTPLFKMDGMDGSQESRQELTLAWKNQHFNQGNSMYHNLGWYDPNSIYHQHYPMDEGIYQTYGEVYGYTPSSVHEEDVISNGWYQVPPVNNPMSQAYGITQPTNSSTIKNSHWGYSSETSNNKYGGLSDLFFDPTARPDVPLMESIANEVAANSNPDENKNFITYGSFRYRNGQRTCMAPSNPRRKMVRFSQTVHRRIETESSEMEDSTSVIKACPDEGSNIKTANDMKIEQELMEEAESIYVYPSHHYCVSNGVSPSLQCHEHNQMPEPIYEFPSGHIESSCMCDDCILARGSCQMRPAQAVAYF